MAYKVGDKVEIIEIFITDEVNNVKLGDVAKVTFVQSERWYVCRNPNWIGGVMPMKYDQIKKVE